MTEVDLAINEKVKRGEEWVDETVFVSVTFWGKTAEIVNEYLGKGSSVLVEGRLKLDQWEQDGQKRSKLKVVADKMQMLDKKGDAKGPRQESEPQMPEFPGDDVAF